MEVEVLLALLKPGLRSCRRFDMARRVATAPAFMYTHVHWNFRFFRRRYGYGGQAKTQHFRHILHLVKTVFEE